jgi:hypothetical protein
MTSLLLEEDVASSETEGQLSALDEDSGWLVFRYLPVSLFSLKMSRATSTAGKTLLVPTPYAVKMAVVDAALRHGLVRDPDDLVRALSKAVLRIGVSAQACVTGTIQSIRQETRDVERKRSPQLPWYRATIAMREFVHYQGELRLAFELKSCAPGLVALLLAATPAINYLGKRGSFFQYVGYTRHSDLDATFTRPVEDAEIDTAGARQRATLDDFGPGACFEALNSFSPAEIRWGVHRRFVETIVPLHLHNTGPGFAHYCVPGAIL